MYVKASTVIPAGMKITTIAPSHGKAKSVYNLLRAEERKLEAQEVIKVKANKFAAALKVGYTVAEALKLTQE